MKGLMTMSEFDEVTVNSESIFQGRIISVRVDEVMLQNDKYAKREIVDHKGAVAVIALTDEGNIVLVKQYRKALERTIIEIPAGGIEAGESLEETAKRELEEETAYRADKWSYLQSFATSPGFANEIIHIYLAEELVKVEHPRVGDEDEFIEVVEVTAEQAEQLIQTQQIFDAKTAWAVLYMQTKLSRK